MNHLQVERFIDPLLSTTFFSSQSEKRIQKSREMKYRELSSRIARENKLQQLERELVVQKALMVRTSIYTLLPVSVSHASRLTTLWLLAPRQGKGRRKKVGTDKNRLAVYKWKADRKK